jgi:small-conductance mechanosensitive channel
MNSSNFEGLMSFMQLFELGKILIFLFGVVFLIIIAKLLKNLAEKLGKNLPSKRLLILQIITIAIFLIYILGSLALFYGALQPSKELILALGGSIAVAVGFALKDLVSSLISGLILLFDQPFQVGDRVSFAGNYGEIKSIGLRAVRLATLDDNLVTIPNSRFLNDVVACGNSGNLDMMVVSDFHIAIDSDLKRAKEIIREAIIVSKYAYLKKPIAIVINEINFGNFVALKLQAKAYVMDVAYEKAFQSDLIERVKDWFEEAGISRPILQLKN